MRDTATRPSGSPLAARLRAGEIVHGAITRMPSIALVETCGRLGFDFALLDTEHGPGDALALEDHIRAADATGMDALVRVPGHADADILRALDAGAAGVVVPHVSSADQARAAVAAAHYPPLGRRGLAIATRAAGHGLVPVADHVRHAAEQSLVIAQIENPAAVTQAARIGQVDGVDALFVGPADLSISMGHPGVPGHPDVVAAIEQAVAGAARAGVAVCAIVSDAQAAHDWVARGARIIIFNVTAIIAGTLKRVADDVRGA